MARPCIARDSVAASFAREVHEAKPRARRPRFERSADLVEDGLRAKARRIPQCTEHDV